MATCTNCGAALNTGDRFCEACGHPVQSTPTFCPRCGRPADPAGEFCLWCGAYVGPPPAPVVEVGSGPAEPTGSGIAGWDLATITLLAGAAIVCLVAVVSDAREWALLARARSGGPVTQLEARANDSRQHSVAVVLLVVFAATALLWLIWQFRAHGVLRRRFSSVRYTPALGITWWFVPIANLFMPFKAVRELFVARPENEMTPDEKRAPLVRWWWATYLLAGGFALVGLIAKAGATDAIRRVPIDRNAFFNDAIAHDWLFILSRLSDAVAAILAIGLVMSVQAKLRPAGVVGRPGLEPGPPD